MKPSPFTSVLIAWSTLLLLTQCQKVTPASPKAEGFDAPIPPARSYLAGSIMLPLRALEAKINKELDPVLVGKGSQEGKGPSLLPFSVIRSGSVQIEYVNQQVRFSAPLQVQLARPFSSRSSTPSKRPFCAIRVNFMSPLTLTPEWRLASRVKFVDYKWEVEPKLTLLGRTISLADFAQNIIEKYRSSIESAIDSTVYKDLRLDKMTSPIWRDMQKPLLLSKEYGLWLLPRPVSIAASPIHGNKQQITAPLLITLDTRTQLDPKEPVAQPTALPPLQKRDTLTKLSNLNVVSFIPYADINRLVAQTLRDKDFKLAFGMLKIKSASVYGGQRSIIVKTDINGLVNGTLYLRGRPAFDTTSNTIRITNLDFDTQTQNAVSNLFNTVFHDGLCRLLEKMLTVPLGQEINQLPQKIDEAFEKSPAGQKTNLNIKSFRFIPQKVAVRPDGVQVSIKVQSEVVMQVQQL